MKIIAIAPCWNEALLLPFYLRHYERFCDHIVVYDNESSDGSMDILLAHPKVELRKLQTGNEYDENSIIALKTAAYQEQRGKADWVIVGDVDELLWHRDMASFLAGCKGRGENLIRTEAYEMVSETSPNSDRQIWEQITQGIPNPRYSKRCCFAPDLNVVWALGCHSASVTPAPRESGQVLPLLHFKFVGREYAKARYAALDARRSKAMRDSALGIHWAVGPGGVDRQFDLLLAQAKELSFLANPPQSSSPPSAAP